jgi:hypothetical protein
VGKAAAKKAHPASGSKAKEAPKKSAAAGEAARGGKEAKQPALQARGSARGGGGGGGGGGGSRRAAAAGLPSHPPSQLKGKGPPPQPDRGFGPRERKAPVKPSGASSSVSVVVRASGAHTSGGLDAAAEEAVQAVQPVGGCSELLLLGQDGLTACFRHLSTPGQLATVCVPSWSYTDTKGVDIASLPLRVQLPPSRGERT